jgi:micrococcal nuclease
MMRRMTKDTLILALSAAAVVTGLAILVYSFAFGGNGDSGPAPEPQPQQAQPPAATATSVAPGQATPSSSPGQCPAGCAIEQPGCSIKGDINAQGEKIYHVPGSPGHASVVISPSLGERWFCTRAEAEANGWRAAQ